ncbi:MAG: hypothetical protein ACKOA8_02435 [Deltaproteobacteria bacterium]
MNPFISAALLLTSLFYLGLPLSNAEAREIKLSSVPIVITGSFKPLRVEINGKSVIQDSKPTTEILINGTTVIPTPQKGAPFFLQTLESRITIKTSLSHQEKVFSLPAASIERQDDKTLEFLTEGDNIEVRINKKVQPLQDRRVQWGIPAERSYAFFIFEIIQKATGLKRTYNLEVLEEKTFPVQKSPNPPEAAIEEVVSPQEKQNKSWLDFTMAPIVAYQSTTRFSPSLNLNWTPSYHLSLDWKLIGHAGGNLFRSYTSSKNFLFLESGLALHHQLNTLGVFAGFGIQVWNQQGGLFLAPQVGLDRSWNKEIWGINLKRLFLGYSTAFTQPSLTHFLRLGAGVSL